MARQLIYDTPEKRKAAQRENSRKYRERLYAGANPEQREKYLARARAQSARARKRPGHKARMKAYLKEYYKNNRDKYWRYRGIAVEPAVYEQMLVDQDNKCAICRKDPTKGRSLCVDHDHQSGRLRGLLCYNCNLAVGHLKDDPALALALVAYLRKVSN